jgi:hypothetical protein
MDERLKAWLIRSSDVKQASEEGKDLYSYIASKMYDIEYKYFEDAMKMDINSDEYKNRMHKRQIVKMLILSAFNGTTELLEGILA